MSSRLCTCSTYCSIVDPGTDIRRPRALVPPLMYQNHQRDQALNEATQSLHRQTYGQAPSNTSIPGPSLLQNLMNEVKFRVKFMILPSVLFFRNPPTRNETKIFEYQSVDPIPNPNDGFFALSHAESSNSTVLTHESHCIEILRTLSNTVASEDREQLEDLIKQELYAIWQFKEREWNRQQTAIADGADPDHAGVSHNTDIYFIPYHPRLPGIWVFLLALAVAMLIYHVSRRVIRLILIAFRHSQKAHNMLEKKLSNGPKKAVLWHICRDNGLLYSGKKAQLIDNIIEWRREVGTEDITIPPSEHSLAATPEPSMGSRQLSQTPSNSSQITQFYTPTALTPVPTSSAITHLHHPTSITAQNFNFGPSPVNSQGDVFVFRGSSSRDLGLDERSLDLDERRTPHGSTIRYAHPPEEHRSNRPRVECTPASRHEVRPSIVAEKKAKWMDGSLTKSMANSL
ncbi:hypothetical protein IW261DRAFT_1426368 [Armillaria novae-zelandiae]|uniref:SAP domain-containing protein n=1 Tax=Armillaria novae-zelandiae TaxID=153914 RepID=A0AA39NN43_9AGAR|nr:hypothetical protein IW261DRAFT_1426368 [Armillaria novae-zelandiae]